ncbi:MAG TPA: laminin B domain-containing protein [Pyrinomonadaceae bacterium]|nr:laminin B domain-containing protein [Pyrinomonadaceae bacterium]
MKGTTQSALSNLAPRTKHGRNSMTMMLPAVCLLLLALAPAARADAIVMSTFDTDAEGWNAVSLNTSYTVTGTHTVTWNATGGNPGGHLSRPDPQVDTTFYWNAPAQFLGDMSAAYGGALTYDVRHSGGPVYNFADVILVGGATPLRLVYDAAALPTTAWTPFTIPFNAGQWRVGSLSGAFATQQQILSVLSALTALRIRGEYISNTNETGYLDNVSVEAPPEPTPEPAALALMGTGLAACAFIARRKHRRHKRRQHSRACRHAYVEPAGLSI